MFLVLRLMVAQRLFGILVFLVLSSQRRKLFKHVVKHRLAFVVKEQPQRSRTDDIETECVDRFDDRFAIVLRYCEAVADFSLQLRRDHAIEGDNEHVLTGDREAIGVKNALDASDEA